MSERQVGMIEIASSCIGELRFWNAITEEEHIAIDRILEEARTRAKKVVK